MRIPRATYRLQLNRGFTFDQAREIVDYLQELGISDVYSSPILEAPPESTHDYDVWNYERLNSTLGGPDAFEKFAGALRGRQMGLLVDFVPNHMGIQGTGNRWWRDVLENGPASQWSLVFDIHWSSDQKVHLPVLGDFYGAVLERGELKIISENDGFELAYFDSRFPINAAGSRRIIESALERIPLPHRAAAKERLGTQPGGTGAALPPSWREIRPLREAMEATLTELNGVPGKRSSFEALHQILELQWYRLLYWVYGRRLINYRRFFEIDTLVGVRMENVAVFNLTHTRILDLIKSGKVTGLRIDHIDGLLAPGEYLSRLQNSAQASSPNEVAPNEPFYIVVEKILAPDEHLPGDWPVHGTTGYEFASESSALLIDPESEKAFTRVYEEFVGDPIGFNDLVYLKKREILQNAFPGELERLATALHQLAQAHLCYRDLAREVWERVLLEFVSCLPVYRTYLDSRYPVREADRKVIEITRSATSDRLSSTEIAGLDLLVDLLLQRWPERAQTALCELVHQFIGQLQQQTGAIMAKGVEDTVFFLYNRFTALNEVGGAPDKFGQEPARFHRQNQLRSTSSPHTLLATSTHDTKMSEDVRARLAALSEIPQAWSTAVQRWAAHNQGAKQAIDGRRAPDANEEYLLYQVLIGSWPLELMNSVPDRSYIERIQNYLQKATREGKVNSSWNHPNQKWEEAQRSFIESILTESDRNLFLRDFHPLAADVSRIGAMNSLAQTLLKSTAPGVPDFYQGTEIWDYSLVDPDNRRPVDYGQRREILQTLASAAPEDLLQNWQSGAIKMFLTKRVLELRAEVPELFQRGDYVPLRIEGDFALSCFAFARRWKAHNLLVLAPRLTARVGFPPIGQVWRETSVVLRASPPSGMRDIFTGNELKIRGSNVRLAEAFSRLPFAVYAWLDQLA